MGWHLFLGAEVFSLSESSWAYLARSFPYRDPLSSIKRGGLDIFLYMQSWVTSKLALGSSAYLFPSALLASVCWCCQPLGVPRRFPSFPQSRTSSVDSYMRKLTVVTVLVSLCLMAYLKPSTLCLVWINTIFILITIDTKVDMFLVRRVAPMVHGYPWTILFWFKKQNWEE